MTTDPNAVAGIAIVCTSIGGAIGRAWGVGKKRYTKEKAMLDAIQQLTWAVAGKPEDQWAKREPGLIEQMSALRADFVQHAATDRQAQAEIIARIDNAAHTQEATTAKTAKNAAEVAAKTAADVVAAAEKVAAALSAHDALIRNANPAT